MHASARKARHLGGLESGPSILRKGGAPGYAGDYVDFGHFEIRWIDAEGLGLPTSTSSPETKLKDTLPSSAPRQDWGMAKMEVKMGSVEHVQSMLNARLHALQKAKVRALKLGTSAPPEFDQLDENLMLVEIMITELCRQGRRSEEFGTQVPAKE